MKKRAKFQDKINFIQHHLGDAYHLVLDKEEQTHQSDMLILDGLKTMSVILSDIETLFSNQEVKKK